jgi:hypothetical protein
MQPLVLASPTTDEVAGDVLFRREEFNRFPEVQVYQIAEVHSLARRGCATVQDHRCLLIFGTFRTSAERRAQSCMVQEYILSY